MIEKIEYPRPPLSGNNITEIIRDWHNTLMEHTTNLNIMIGQVNDAINNLSQPPHWLPTADSLNSSRTFDPNTQGVFGDILSPEEDLYTLEDGKPYVEKDPKLAEAAHEINKIMYNSYSVECSDNCTAAWNYIKQTLEEKGLI